jgi:hypothetical protein
MNSNVNPLIAAIVILLVCTGSVIWMWGTGEAEEISGPSEMLTDPAGHLYVQIQDQLVEHDENGIYVKRHDLGNIGIDRVLGGLAFFSDGDLLVRRGPDSRTFLDGVRAFSRQTNNRSIVSSDPATGLHRCNLNNYECQPFGTPTIDFNAAFSIFIDPDTDDVYISDTSRHLLRKYSSQGEVLSPPADGFRFPNHLIVHDGNLLVADTNTYSIRQVTADSAGFGDYVDTFNVTPGEAQRAEQRWPSHFVQVGNEWWVNNMATTMSDGGIYTFDKDWQFQRRLELPQGADPISMLVFRDKVLVTDWNNSRVHQFTFAGIAESDFISAGLTEIYAESGETRLRYLMFTWATLLLLAAIAVILVIKGTTPADAIVPDTDNTVPENSEVADFNKHIWLKPIPETVKNFRRGFIVAGILMAIVVVMFFYIGIAISTDFLDWEFALHGFIFVSIYLTFAWISRVNFGTTIGLYRDRIILRDHSGREVKHAIKDAIYDGTMIATPDMAIALGNNKFPFYDKETIASVLLPRLDKSQEVTVVAMQAALIRMRHPLGILNVAGLVVIAGLFAWMLFDTYL